MMKEIPQSLRIAIREYLNGDPDGVGGTSPISETERAERLALLLDFTTRAGRPKLWF